MGAQVVKPITLRMVLNELCPNWNQSSLLGNSAATLLRSSEDNCDRFASFITMVMHMLMTILPIMKRVKL